MSTRTDRSDDEDSLSTAYGTASSADSVQALRGVLEEQPYYHGLLARSDCDDLLPSMGDFLVRISMSDGGVPASIISVHTNEDLIVHMQVYCVDDPLGTGVLYEIAKDVRFQSIPALVTHYMTTREVVQNVSSFDKTERNYQLLNAVSRPKWHLARSQVKLEEKLGDGAFGDVFRGRLMVGKGHIAVAIKSMKVVPGKYIDKSAREEFMKEARFMRRYEHENLVRLMGAVLDDLPLYLVMELCEGGSVLDRLDSDPPLAELSLLERNTWLMHIAQGMRALEKHGVLHRDLAARNCLLGRGGVCKVGDLGLAIHQPTGFEPYMPHLRVPIKWLSPEAFTTRSTSPRSDVWAYGILIWEIYNNGAPPYEAFTSQQMRKFHLEDNLPPLKPGPLMTKKMKAVMESCMLRDWTVRPNFLALKLTMRRRCRANKLCVAS